MIRSRLFFRLIIASISVNGLVFAIIFLSTTTLQDRLWAFTHHCMLQHIRGRFEAAISLCSEAIHVDPQNPVAYRERGLAYYKKGDNDRAVVDYNESIRLAGTSVGYGYLQWDSAYASAYRDRGYARLNKGDYDGAISDFTESVRFFSNDVYVFYNLGVAYAKKEQHRDAIIFYTAAIRLNPSDFDFYNSRAFSKWRLGDDRSAINDLDDAIQLMPNDVWAYNMRGYIYSNIGDYSRSIASFSVVIGLNPPEKWKLAFAYRGRGDARRAKGDFTGAVADHDAAFDLERASNYTSP
jgi:tetratricopeptide (TPR) repeat protein